jgi:tetratricopeptide (TPR) repeat protein
MLALTLAFSWQLGTTSASASPQSDRDWEKLQRSGSEALDANQFWIAEPLLKQALDAADEFDQSDIRLARSLGEVGRLHTIRGRFAQAEPYLEKSLMVKERAFASTPGATIPDTGALIKFYLTYGTVGKAEPLTERMLFFLDGKLKEPPEQVAPKTTVAKGQPLQAWAGTAAPVMVNPLIEWAITCDSVGNMYRERGNLALADRLFKAALDLKTSVLGKDHLSLANSYDSLGTICTEKNEETEAQSYFRDSLATTERTLPRASHQVYQRIDKLAKSLIKDGKYKEAEELYLQAQKNWKNEPSRNGDEARALFALGCLYLDQKKYAEAAPVLQQALQLAEHFNGPSSIALVPYLQKYAYTLYYLGRKPEMDQLTARASTISGGK